MLYGIAKPLFLGTGLFELLLGPGKVALRLKPVFPAGFQLFQNIFMTGGTVEQRDMCRCIEKAAPFKLALDFDKSIADFTEKGG